MTETAPGDLIELRVDNIAQLFHTLDPFPFRERDLDKEAEEFIVGWARELAADRAIEYLSFTFPEAEAQTKAARELKEAFLRYFSDHAGTTQREIKELFRIGRRSLGIGVTILTDMPSVSTPRGWLSDRYPVPTLGSRRVFSFSVGCELAASRNILE